MLDLKDQQTKLYSTIENYWLQANTNQSQFKAAKTSTESAKTSYDLLSEQFKLGLKNIVELRRRGWSGSHRAEFLCLRPRRADS